MYGENSEEGDGKKNVKKNIKNDKQVVNGNYS
jgi:hypothetical protein